MQPEFEKDFREKMEPFVVPVVRSIGGVTLGVVLSMIGIVIAWSLYVFFGGRTIETWMASLFFSAGAGAGIATFTAWLHIDRENGWVLALTAVVVLGAGILGAWGGYQYGAAQEIECCAMPTVSPVYYTALGSAVVANIAGIVFATIRAIITRNRKTQIYNAVN